MHVGVGPSAVVNWPVLCYPIKLMAIQPLTGLKKVENAAWLTQDAVHFDGYIMTAKDRVTLSVKSSRP